MKQFLYIIGFILVSLLATSNEVKEQYSPAIKPEIESFMQETEQARRDQCVAILSNDIKNSNLISPRRILTTVSYNFNVRIPSQTEKQIQYFRLKGYDLMAKLLEDVSVVHHINYSSLLCRNGYHIFALRKLLI